MAVMRLFACILLVGCFRHGLGGEVTISGNGMDTYDAAPILFEIDVSSNYEDEKNDSYLIHVL